MGNILKGLSELLSKNGNIISALTNSQAESDSVISNLSFSNDGANFDGKKTSSCHVFSEQGAFLRSQNKEFTASDTDRGTNIYIETTVNKEKQLVKLTDFPMPTAETTDGLAKIFQFYASTVDIAVGTDKNKVGIKAKESAGDALLFTTGSNIYADSTGGKLKPGLFDYYNVQNGLLHEYYHRLNAEKNIKDGEGEESYEHAKVYLLQIKHPTFKKTTAEFQQNRLRTLTETYLTASITKAGLQDDVIKKFVDELNVVLKSYKKELEFYFEVTFVYDTAGNMIFKIKRNEK